MPLLGVSRNRQTSLNKCLHAVVFCFALSSVSLVAAPGAHGPDGEHLDTQSKQPGAQNPKFETFTETFELMAELTGHELAIYLHDYRSNVPVANAMIEIATGEQSAEATYEAAGYHYIVTQDAFLHAIESPGEYAITLTIITEDVADLMEATLVVPEARLHDEKHGHEHPENLDAEHEQAHRHDHSLWWAIPLTLLSFLAGYMVNRRQNRGATA